VSEKQILLKAKKGEVYKKFFHFSRDLMFLTNGAGVCLEGNENFRNLLSKTDQKMSHMSLFELVLPAYHSALQSALQGLKESGSYAGEFALSVCGELMHLTWRARFDFEQDLIYWIGCDTTERDGLEEEMIFRLKRKEVLFKEAHHRIKNNLQTILSLLNLQRNENGHSTDELLTESAGRIRAMALIHEQLSESDEMTDQIDIGAYVKVLTKNLCRSYGVSTTRVLLKFEFDRVAISAEKAAPCGLIVNEIVSNSLKHAFAEGQSGNIRIRMRHRGSRLQIEIGDDGIGLPREIDVKKAKTLGLRLITMLVKQLDGTLEVIRDGGITYRIQFKDQSRELD
jgi:two-component sensor histidine kinase